ncbi:MAG: protease inhibitor I42 family protein [Segetibacter sp.]
MTTVTLTENNNQKRIEIHADDLIQIHLDKFPTTGYRWEITELYTNDMRLISQDFKLHSNSGVGGGGKKMIQLKVLRKASGRIKLENRQPWSGDVYKRFEVSYS